MTTEEHLAGHWREWRHARIATLTRPYGWTSLVAQHWLADGDRDVHLELLPGTWGVDGGRVIFTPPPTGSNLSVAGEYPTEPVEIIPGRNQTYGNGRSVPVYFGGFEVETIVRSNEAGDGIFAVRVRDPREAARKDFSRLGAYDYDPAWRVETSFEPADRRDSEAPTVEQGVRETTSSIGTLRFDLQGEPYELTVSGKDSAHGVRPVLHVRDVTNGETTYAAGRVLDLAFADDDGRRIDVADFNYLFALPCAFTNFVTCPITPRENHLDVAILAGEKRPAQTVDRVRTYEKRVLVS